MENKVPERDESLSLLKSESLPGYDPDTLDAEIFRKRYAGIYTPDKGKRLSRSSIVGIWRSFLRKDRVDFFKAHVNFTMYDIARIGIDKFIYTMGWTKKEHVSRWRSNRVRVGICGHCQDQFIPMILQHNFGLCNNCKPLYSIKAIRQFIMRELNNSERYHSAHRDLFMDFYILFYRDDKFRPLFLSDSETAEEWAAMEHELPDWYQQQAAAPISLSQVVSELYGQDD